MFRRSNNSHHASTGSNGRPILISLSGGTPAVGRLAELEGRELPDGPFLLAEVDGELIAAAALDGESEPLADPFAPTAEVSELLRFRTRRLRSSGPYLRRAA